MVGCCWRRQAKTLWPWCFWGRVSFGLGPACRRAWSLCFFFVCPSGRPRPWGFFCLVPTGAFGSLVVFGVVVVVSLFERPWVVGRPRRNQTKKNPKACGRARRPTRKKKTESPVPRYSAQTQRRHNPRSTKAKESWPATASNNRPQPPETSGRAHPDATTASGYQAFSVRRLFRRHRRRRLRG